MVTFLGNHYFCESVNRNISRRTVLASAVALLTGTAGCNSLSSRNDTDQDSEQLELEGVSVTNKSGGKTLFNVTVVRNGDAQYQSQLTIPPGETRRPATAWKGVGNSFVIVGMSKQYANYEVVSMNAEKDLTKTPLSVSFTINGDGDVHGTQVRAGE